MDTTSFKMSKIWRDFENLKLAVKQWVIFVNFQTLWILNFVFVVSAVNTCIMSKSMSLAKSNLVLEKSIRSSTHTFCIGFDTRVCSCSQQKNDARCYCIMASVFPLQIQTSENHKIRSRRHLSKVSTKKYITNPSNQIPFSSFPELSFQCTVFENSLKCLISIFEYSKFQPPRMAGLAVYRGQTEGHNKGNANK